MRGGLLEAPAGCTVLRDTWTWLETLGTLLLLLLLAKHISNDAGGGAVEVGRGGAIASSLSGNDRIGRRHGAVWPPRALRLQIYPP